MVFLWSTSLTVILSLWSITNRVCFHVWPLNRTVITICHIMTVSSQQTSTLNIRSWLLGLISDCDTDSACHNWSLLTMWQMLESWIELNCLCAAGFKSPATSIPTPWVHNKVVTSGCPAAVCRLSGSILVGKIDSWGEPNKLSSCFCWLSLGHENCEQFVDMGT